METFLGGLGIMLVGGMVTVALKYPEGYKRLYALIGLLSFLLSTGVTVYTFGLRRGAKAVYPFLDPAKLAEAKAVAVALEPPLWLVVGNAIFFFFALALIFLRPILGRPEDDKK
jgi:hypothetical protein